MKVLLLLLALTSPLPAAYTTTARGVSMLPAFPVRVTITVDPDFPFDKLQAGMTVVYRNRFTGSRVHHRLMSQDHRGRWRVKGDNNTSCDRDMVTPANYLGRTNPITQK